MICVTNDMPDIRSCTYLDSHLDSCDGFEYAWVEKRRRSEATGKQCRGCEPKKAYQGFVCRGCFMGITAAVSGATSLITALGAIDRAKMSDTEGRSSSSLGYVPLPATRLAIDELGRYPYSSGTPELWVSNSFGAEQAVNFAKAYTAAVRSFPLKEEPHPLKRARCPKCEALSLVWHPPQFIGMDAIVRCRDSECGYVVNQDGWETALTEIENPAYAAKTKAVSA